MRINSGIIFFIMLLVVFPGICAAASVPPPGALTIPVADADGSYIVKWTASSTTGVSYILEEATNPTFSANKRIIYSGTALQKKITGNKKNRTYYYRVQAAKSGFTPSRWVTGNYGCAVPGSAKAAAPGTVTIPATDADGTYYVKWVPSRTARVTYILEEATNNKFTNATIVYSGTARQKKITNRQKDTTYYYRLRAVKAGLKDSPWRKGKNGCLIKEPFIYRLPDSGQKKSFSSKFGDDGSYSINPLSYTDNSDGTVTDNNTGLMWQQNDDAALHNWYEAAGVLDEKHNPDLSSVCKELATGDYTDWRLPTRKELIGIIDYGRQAPAIDSTTFPGTKPSNYWTSSSNAGNPDSAMSVYFGNGYIYNNLKSNSYYVRCVRDGL